VGIAIGHKPGMTTKIDLVYADYKDLEIFWNQNREKMLKKFSGKIDYKKCIAEGKKHKECAPIKELEKKSANSTHN
jgi:hypothetical protein